jgi:tetratricopeptide (TPR) repeat protein
LESVQLFLERARDVAPDLVLDSATAPAVAEICFRLDGLPLALELAAARTAALGPAQIAARLGDVLALLDRGSRYALDRQRTLAATLTWSHDLLDGSERLLFRRLAVFAGGWSLDAVEGVCASDGPDRLDVVDIVDVLSRLVDKSLVQTDRIGGAVRYRLLETVRQFAVERLRAAGEQAAFTRRHRDWYTALAEASDPEGAIGVVDEAPRALDDEHDNLRAALATGLADDPTTALRLAVGLWRFWLARSHFGEGSRWLESALARSPDRTPLRARALFAAAALDVRRGDPTGRLLKHSEEALEIMREAGDDVAVAIALDQAAALSLGGPGGLARAVRLAEDGRSLASDEGAVPMVASSTHLLGVIALCRGRGAEAVDCFTRTLALLARLPPDLPPFFAVVAPCWSLEVDARGEHRMLFEETSLLFRRVGRDQAAAYTTSNLAYAVGLDGHQVEPRDLVQDSLATFRRLADPHGETLALCHLANIDRRLGDLAGAGALLERALDIRSSVGDRRGIGVVVSNQALVAAAAGDLRRADRLLRTATVLFEESDDGPGARGARHNLGMVLLAAGDRSGAREALSRSWSDRPDILVYERPMAWALVALAGLERDRGDDRAAALHLREAKRRFTALGDVHGLAHVSGSR